ncbi:hypothetical protein BU23DRAFT_165285 [Bimuria novae-zelandiae CBS 107.79]|uniref:Uncharacterized protein n=1 Tax=Bimuria novae-zelandiae CBS 107.79 TaxID=1447943 RepID=A0A6A5VG81_9PLEO|nr:hypothetical protein BU23DRAFT_165285 [Bimuria novae-zelandiae CBS 107.79]
MSGAWNSGGDILDDFDDHHGQSAPWLSLEDGVSTMPQPEDNFSGSHWPTNMLTNAFDVNNQQDAPRALIYDASAATSPFTSQPNPYAYQSAFTNYSAPPLYANPSVYPSYTNSCAPSHSDPSSSASYDDQFMEEYSQDWSSVGSRACIKRENQDDEYLPAFGAEDGADDDDAHDEGAVRQSSKKRKLNKDGKERKARDPRGHLRTWGEQVLTKALIGVVWACGENGVEIPFEQAAQMVDEKCTSGALQQAILKARTKANTQWNMQLPNIKMHWPKKPGSEGKSAHGKSATRDNGKVPRKKPTMMKSTQCNLTTLRGVAGQHILMTAGLEEHAAHDNILPGRHNINNVQVQYAQLPHRPGPVNATNSTTQVDASSGMQSVQDGTASLQHAQHLQGPAEEDVLSGQVIASGSSDAKPRKGDESVPAQSDQTQVAQTQPGQMYIARGPTPEQLQLSPVCPPPPHHSRLMRINSRLSGNGAVRNLESTFAQHVQQSPSSLVQQHHAHQSTAPYDYPDLVLSGPHGPLPGHVSRFPGPGPMLNNGMMSAAGPSSGSKDSSGHRKDSLNPNDPHGLSHPGGTQGSQAHQTSTMSDMTLEWMAPFPREVHDANNRFCRNLEATANDRFANPMQSRTTSAFDSLQQRRQPISRGNDRVPNPFGGYLNDALDVAAPSAVPANDQSMGDCENELDDFYGVGSSVAESTQGLGSGAGSAVNNDPVWNMNWTPTNK